MPSALDTHRGNVDEEASGSALRLNPLGSCRLGSESVPGDQWRSMARVEAVRPDDGAIDVAGLERVVELDFRRPRDVVVAGGRLDRCPRQEACRQIWHGGRVRLAIRGAYEEQDQDYENDPDQQQSAQVSEHGPPIPIEIPDDSSPDTLTTLLRFETFLDFLAVVFTAHLGASATFPCSCTRNLATDAQLRADQTWRVSRQLRECDEAALVRQAAGGLSFVVDAPLQELLTLRYEIDVVDPPEGPIPEPAEAPCVQEADGGPQLVIIARGWWGIPLSRTLWDCRGAHLVPDALVTRGGR